MGRRAAELAGVLIASLITSFVTGLALSGPNEPVLYVVGALVPLALLLVYWLWLEPRADADRLRARRLQQAVEDAGKALLARMDAEPDPSSALITEIGAWENRTGDQIEVTRGSGDALSFRHPSGMAASEPRKRLESQVLLLEIWVGDERKRAGDRAKDRYR
jgi:hypothetical protein